MLYKRIRYFLEAADCLNFSTAAKNLFISQQAMTWHIACLEEYLGVKLFVRSTRSVNLTEAGKVCRDEFIRLNASLDEAVAKVRAAALVNVTTITIGFTDFLSRPVIVTPIMDALFDAFPDVNFNIRMYPYARIRNALLDGNVDLCVSTSAAWGEWPDVQVHTLGSYAFRAFFSVSHPLAKKLTVTLEDLKPYRRLSFNQDGASGWRSRIGSEVMLVPDLHTALAYIESCRGYAALTRVFQDAGSPTLTSAPLPFPEARADLICARRKNMMNPLVLSVIKRICALAAEPDVFETEEKD